MLNIDVPVFHGYDVNFINHPIMEDCSRPINISKLLEAEELFIYSRTALYACIIPFEYGFNSLWGLTIWLSVLSMPYRRGILREEITMNNHTLNFFWRYKECQKFNYKVILGGDFNSHISNDSQGIPGNQIDINANGQLFRDFHESSQLLLANNASCAEGL